MKQKSTVKLLLIPALFSAGFVFFPTLWSANFGFNSYRFLSVLSLAVPVFFLLFLFTRPYTTGKEECLDIIDILIACYIVYATVNTFLHNRPLTHSIILKWITFCGLYLTVRVMSAKHQGQSILLFGIILSGTIQSIIFLVQKISHYEVFFNPFSATAQFSNPGHLAAYLAVIFPLPLFLSDRQKHKSTRCILRIISVLLLVSVILTISRGPILACVIALILYLCSKIITGKKSIVMPVLMLTLVLAACSLLYTIRPKSAESRLLIWKVTSNEFKSSPILGKGTLSLAIDYMNLQADYFRKNPDSRYWTTADNNYQSFNEPLHLLYEQGVVGFIILLSAIAVWFKRQIQTSLRIALASFLVVSCFLYISDIGPLFCILPVLIGTRSKVHSNTKEIAIGNSSKHKYQIKAAVLTVLTLGILLLSLICVKDLRAASSELRGLMRDDKLYSDICDKHKSILKSNLGYALILSKQIVKHGSQEEGIDVITQILGNTISTSDMYCDLGDLYAQSGNYANACLAYKEAFYMVPGMITPLIKLFNLQIENNDISGAKLTAERILNNRYKITGSLVVRSKNQAKHFIDKLNYSNL